MLWKYQFTIADAMRDLVWNAQMQLHDMRTDNMVSEATSWQSWHYGNQMKGNVYHLSINNILRKKYFNDYKIYDTNAHIHWYYYKIPWSVWCKGVFLHNLDNYCFFHATKNCQIHILISTNQHIRTPSNLSLILTGVLKHILSMLHMSIFRPRKPLQNPIMINFIDFI